MLNPYEYTESKNIWNTSFLIYLKNYQGISIEVTTEFLTMYYQSKNRFKQKNLCQSKFTNKHQFTHIQEYLKYLLMFSFISFVLSYSILTFSIYADQSLANTRWQFKLLFFARLFLKFQSSMEHLACTFKFNFFTDFRLDLGRVIG